MAHSLVNTYVLLHVQLPSAITTPAEETMVVTVSEALLTEGKLLHSWPLLRLSAVAAVR